jgi:hypothetical protein
MIKGVGESIRIEDPGIAKAEFVVTVSGRRHYHQAKRSSREGKWSLSKLGSKEIELLQAIFDELEGNDSHFHFVSECDAPELKELCTRAKNAESLDEFEEKFLRAQSHRDSFGKLRSFWSDCSPTTAFDILRRVDVETASESLLERLVHQGLELSYVHFLEVCELLRNIVTDSVIKTLTRTDLVEHLASRGHKIRALVSPENAPALLVEITNRHLDDISRRLIANSLIRRPEVLTLLQQITGSEQGLDVVIVGKAGAGKTGCVYELVSSLRDQGVPVMSFRLDRIDDVSTPIDLGKKLGLDESPILVLEAAAGAGGAAVLVVDQFDAVSTASGRSSGLLGAVEGLVREARGIGNRVRLTVVVVCRTYDLEHDPALRRAVGNQATMIELGEFSLAQTEAVLREAGYERDRFTGRQLELLRLPQNLALFLKSNPEPSSSHAFISARELFEGFWNCKRRRIAELAGATPDRWMEAVSVMTEEMSRTQQLFVLREKLDGLPPEVLSNMVSEGVLTFDELRYGFGHESFFDYCFARAFVAREEQLTTYLKTTEQHLFRRSQVRQVIAYLREADRVRYCREVDTLLKDCDIRGHVKDVVLALLSSVADPGDDEWALVSDLLLRGQVARTRGSRSEGDKVPLLVWHHFRTSESWFHFLEGKGLLAEWLASQDGRVVDLAVDYLRQHQRHSGDKVAELLEPYAGKGGDWTKRLRFAMEWAEHSLSPRFHALLLRLIDDGTMDEARHPVAINSRFFDMFHGLGKTRPDWMSEILGHWMRRRFLAFVEQAGKTAEAALQWNGMFDRDSSVGDDIADAAGQAPEAFVAAVLPVVMEISDAALYEEDILPPRRDAVWSFMIISAHPSVADACRAGLAAALGNLAKSAPESLREILPELRRRNTYMANYLLLSTYTGGAQIFADEAGGTLADQVWRYDCGYIDSDYWIARQTIGAIYGSCSPEVRARLEDAVLGYVPEYERTIEGMKLRGHASFTLASAIPIELLSSNGQGKFRELSRKFRTTPASPTGIQTFTVASPIPGKAAERMDDEEWLHAIEKYKSEDRGSRWIEPGKGGLWELASMLRDHASKEPVRFARLCIAFPAGTHSGYTERILEGVKGTDAPDPLKIELCRKAYRDYPVECGKAIADLLGTFRDPLPVDAVGMLHWLSTEHPDPVSDPEKEGAEAERQPEYLEGLLTRGMNSTRGRAAEAIRDLVGRNEAYVHSFRSTLERLVGDESMSVRACAASALLAVASRDWQLALKMFQNMMEPKGSLGKRVYRMRLGLPSRTIVLSWLARVVDRRFSRGLLAHCPVLATPYAERFIYLNLLVHFEDLRPFVELMLRSGMQVSSEAGARLSCLAVLLGKDARALVSEAMSGGSSKRLGVAKIASKNIGQRDCRPWCEEQLLTLFNDKDAEVLREAASCFRSLEDRDLNSYDNFIRAFSESAAYGEDSFSLLHVLEESRGSIPGITIEVCRQFLERFGEEAQDMRTRRAGDSHMVAKLVFRTYHQHQGDAWAPKCLGLIDGMCLEGLYDVKRGLDEFER